MIMERLLLNHTRRIVSNENVQKVGDRKKVCE